MLAAAMAYYTLFSLAQLMVITIPLAERFLDETDVQLLLILRIRLLAGTEVSEFVRSLVQGFGQNSTGLVASIISLVIMIYGASNVFRQMKRALNIVWGISVEEIEGLTHFLKMNLLSFGLVLVVGGLLITAVAMNTLAGVVSGLLGLIISPAPRVSFLFEYAVPFIIIIFLFALLFKLVPDVELRWRDVWWGALLTAFLTGLVLAALRIYLALSSFGAAYGAAGSLVVLLFLVYNGAQIFVFGAEFTQVYARQYGSQTPVKKEKLVEPVDKKKVEQEAGKKG
jgi:membrane protein